MAAGVYSAISAITAELSTAGIAKTHLNAVDQYQYRSIDDVLDRLSPLLAKHRLCVLPRVLRRSQRDRDGIGDALLIHVTLKVRFDLVSADDGSTHVVEAFGEALDNSDKGTAKAMSSAYKAAMLQTFCIPVTNEDADATSTRLKRRSVEREPLQGWDGWVRDIRDIIAVCESSDALKAVQHRNASLLVALQRAQPELYRELGNAVSERQAAVARRPKPKSKEEPKKRSSRRNQKRAASAEMREAVGE